MIYDRTTKHVLYFDAPELATKRFHQCFELLYGGTARLPVTSRLFPDAHMKRPPQLRASYQERRKYSVPTSFVPTLSSLSVFRTAGDANTLEVRGSGDAHPLEMVVEPAQQDCLRLHRQQAVKFLPVLEQTHELRTGCQAAPIPLSNVRGQTVAAPASSTRARRSHGSIATCNKPGTIKHHT